MKTIFISFIFLSFLLFAPSMGVCRQQPVIITAHGSMINVEASGVPLGEVIKAISEKTGILFKFGAPLTETVSFSLKAISAEEAIKQLLANRSYTLSFKKTDDGQFTPVELLVVANRPTDPINIQGMSLTGQNESGTPLDSQMMKKSTNDQYAQQLGNADSLSKQTAGIPASDRPLSGGGLGISNPSENGGPFQISLASGGNVGASMQSARQTSQSTLSTSGGQSNESVAPTSDSRMKSLSRDQYSLQFGNADSLSQQISAIPINDGPLSRGIKITSLAENSTLSQLGLSSGDVINKLNGAQVQSAEEFVQSLSSLSGYQPIVRIERTRNGRTDPIYLRLR